MLRTVTRRHRAVLALLAMALSLVAGTWQRVADVQVTATPVSLLTNTSFETSTQGWTGWHSDLSLATRNPAPNGTHGVRASATTGGQYSLDSEPQTVLATANESLSAAAYVQAANAATLGTTVALTIRERDPSGVTLHETTSAPFSLTYTFTRITTSTTATKSGDHLDIYIMGSGGDVADAFVADLVTLTGTPQPTPTPTPTPRPTATPTPPPTSTPAPTSSTAFGIYLGPPPGGVTNIPAFSTWVGHRTDLALAFEATASWSDIANPSWAMNQWEPWLQGQTGRTLALSIPMLPDNDGTIAAGSTGAYNAQFQALGRLLVAHHAANTVLRIGWEFHGNWYRWGAHSNPAQWAAYYRQIVTAMRSVPGQHFVTNWTLGPNTASWVLNAYPGDSYVDQVGLDAYDVDWSRYPTSGTITTAMQQAAWNNRLSGTMGLLYWASFVATHHKVLTFPEWGVWAKGSGHGGGDDPTYIQGMHDFIANSAHHVAWHAYFDVSASDGDHQIWPNTVFPNSAAKYKSLFTCGSATKTC